jgi:hypothetical protein
MIKRIEKLITMGCRDVVVMEYWNDGLVEWWKDGISVRNLFYKD